MDFGIYQKTLFFLLLLLLLSGTYLPRAYANILGNPSFEDAIGGSTNNWDSTNGAIRVDTATMPAGFTIPPPDGNWAIQMTTGAADGYTFQVKDGVKPGDFVDVEIKDAYEYDLDGVCL